jgi:hypothetical protein
LLFDLQSHTNIRSTLYKKEVWFSSFVCIATHQKHIKNHMSYWTKKQRNIFFHALRGNTFFPNYWAHRAKKINPFFVPHARFTLTYLCQFSIYGIQNTYFCSSITYH